MKLAALLLATLAPLALTAACGKKDGDGAAAKPAVVIDVDGVNALVPASLKATLVFEKGQIKEERGRDVVTYTLATPKGWAQDRKDFATLKPAGADMFSSNIDVGSNCDGVCQPKDWAATADKVNFAQFKDGKVLTDEKTDTSRLMIVERDDNTFVQYARWTKGASYYETCMVTLKQELREAAPAFAKACQAVDMQGRH